MRAMRPKPAAPRTGTRATVTALKAADHRAYFGPLFFIQNLRGLVRERCPEPADGIPSVQIHLGDGDTLDVCHIIGIAPGWIALAVHEREGAERAAELRTELVPYPLITRVSIQSTRHDGSHPIGFNVGNEPALYGNVHATAAMTPEDALRALAGAPITAARPTVPKRRSSAPPTGRARRPR